MEILSLILFTESRRLPSMNTETQKVHILTKFNQSQPFLQKEPLTVQNHNILMHSPKHSCSLLFRAYTWTNVRNEIQIDCASFHRSCHHSNFDRIIKLCFVMFFNYRVHVYLDLTSAQSVKFILDNKQCLNSSK